MGAIDQYFPLLTESNRRWVRFGLVVAGIIAAFWLAQRLSDVLTPIAISLAIAYILNPLVTQMERRSISRLRSTIWIFTLGFLALGAVVALVATAGVSQTARFVADIDTYREWIERWLAPYFPGWMAKARSATQSAEMQQQLMNFGRTAAAAFALNVGLFLDNVARWLTAAVLIPMYTFYFLLQFNDIVAAVRNHLPAAYREQIVRIVSVTDAAVADFFRGRLIVSLVVGVLTALGWLIVGVPYSVPLGLLAGLLNLVPVMSIVVLPPAMLFTYVSATHAGDGWVMPVVLAVAVYFLVQAIDNFVLSPYITGQTSGLHPIATVIALLVGAELGGVLGMLLSIPLTSTLRYVAAEYWLPEIRRLASSSPRYAQSPPVSATPDTGNTTPPENLKR